jgi:hypothetical protein
VPVFQFLQQQNGQWTSTAGTSNMFVSFAETANETGAERATRYLVDTYREWSQACYDHQIMMTVDEQAGLFVEQLESELERVGNTLIRETARNLLFDHLDEQQQATYAHAGFFDVVSQHGNHYRLYEGMQHNIHELVLHECRDGGFRYVPLRELCVYTTEGVPIEDNLLAQKLALECAEDHIRRFSNFTEINESYRMNNGNVREREDILPHGRQRRVRMAA